MEKKNYNGYSSIDEFNKDVDAVEEKMDNIGKENIIKHSVLAEITEDVQNIDGKIKATSKDNRKKKCIRNVKFFGNILKSAAQYVLVAGLLFGFQAGVGDIPFVRQDVMKYARHKVVMFDSGQIKDDFEYQESIDKPTSVAYYIGKWEERNGKYYRTIKQYVFDGYNLSELKTMVTDPNLSIEKAFGQPTKRNPESKTELSEKEKATGDYFEIIYNYSDDENFVLEAQDSWPNIWQSGAYLIFFAFFSAIVFLIKIESNVPSLSKVWNMLKEKYNPVDVDELKRLFEERKIKLMKVSLVDGTKEMIELDNKERTI